MRTPQAPLPTTGPAPAPSPITPTSPGTPQRPTKRKRPGKSAKGTQKAKKPSVWSRAVEQARWFMVRTSYGFLRGDRARRLAQMTGWDRPVDTEGFTSTTQSGALSPVLAITRPGIIGPVMGTNLMTGQAVTHSVQGLYRTGATGSPNVVIAGDIGVAKSTLAKCLIARDTAVLDYLESGPAQHRAVVFDRKRQVQAGEATAGEYLRLADLVESQVITLDRDPNVGTRVNILDPAIASTTGSTGTVGQDRLLTMVSETAKGEPLSPEEHFALHVAHKAAKAWATSHGKDAPVLSDVVKALYEPTIDQVPGPRRDGVPILLENQIVDRERVTEWGLPLALSLERYLDGDMSGLLDGQTRGPGGEPVTMDAPLIVIDTSALPEGSVALSLMMTVFATYLMSVWALTPGMKTLVLEEAYSAAHAGDMVPLVLKELVKRSRGSGTSVWSVFHHVSDVPKDSPLFSLLREAGVVHIFRQSRPEDAAALVDLYDLPPGATGLIQHLHKGDQIYIPGRFPPTVVRTTRTEIEKWVTHTDTAIRAIA